MITKLLEQAVEIVQRMPPADQDAIAEAMLGMARIGDGDDVDPEHVRDAEEALAEVKRGEVATQEEVAAAFRRFER